MSRYSSFVDLTIADCYRPSGIELRVSLIVNNKDLKHKSLNGQGRSVLSIRDPAPRVPNVQDTLNYMKFLRVWVHPGARSSAFAVSKVGHASCVT